MIHRVVLLAMPGVTTFDLTCAMQILAHDSVDPSVGRRYDVSVCGIGRHVKTREGLSLALDHPLARLQRADTVVVPGYLVPLAGSCGECQATLSGVPS